jgi:hypothetical protein
METMFRNMREEFKTAPVMGAFILPFNRHSETIYKTGEDEYFLHVESRNPQTGQDQETIEVMTQNEVDTFRKALIRIAYDRELSRLSDE